MFVILWTLHVPASASPDPDGGGDSRRFLPPSGSAAATAAERGPRATAALRITPAQLVDGRPVGSRREVTLTIAEHDTGVGGGCRCHRCIGGTRFVSILLYTRTSMLSSMLLCIPGIL